MIKDFNGIDRLNGILKLPGDKSISHRSVMFSAMAKGNSEIYNCLMSKDVISTIDAFRLMGCRIEGNSEKIVVFGKGFGGLERPKKTLYLGNSGTTTRLLTGLLTVQNFSAIIAGDKSLSMRPMQRIIDPLSQMGANIKSSNGFLPMEVYPSKSLKPISYKLPIASAQVKSAVLIAGLHLEEETVVIEDKLSRDHTERMLDLKILEDQGIRKIYSSKKDYPQNNTYIVPSDISTSSFFIVPALILPDSEIRLNGISLNESRTGVISILKKMGGDITFDNLKNINGEPRGDIIVKSSRLTNVEIPSEMIPNIIDEIPILSIAGIFAEGEFLIKNAEELRHKESDRIKSVVSNLRVLGLNTSEFTDGFAFHGIPKNDAVVFDSYDDHRIAMAFSVLSLLLAQGGKVNNFECVNISNPNFIEQLKHLV